MEPIITNKCMWCSAEVEGLPSHYCQGLGQTVFHDNEKGRAAYKESIKKIDEVPAVEPKPSFISRVLKIFKNKN